MSPTGCLWAAEGDVYQPLEVLEGAGLPPSTLETIPHLSVCAHCVCLLNIQVMVSTYTQILSFDMKENGKEGGSTVRSLCGFFLQLPPHG